MKTLLALLAAMLTAATVSAMNITLKDGTIYPNAVVMSTDNNGIWIQCANGNGTFYEEHVNYSELATASYNFIQPQTANSTMQDLYSIRLRFQQIAKMEKQQKKNNPTGGNYLKRTYSNIPGQPIILPGVPSQIRLDSVKVYGNGTIGWANSDPDFADNINYGRIYVYGIQIPQQEPWAGRVYPTNKTITFNNWTLPCFATTPADARNINAQQW